MAFTELKQAAARTIPAPKDLQQIGLTVREGEVLHWVIQGKRDKEVGDILSKALARSTTIFEASSGS